MLLGIAATMNVMAVNYSATATLNLSATSGYGSVMYLQQSNAFGELDGAEMYMDVVGLYAIKGTTPLQIAQAADFTNVALGLKTDASTSYTITVSGATGDLVLYDLADMTNIKSYPLVNGQIEFTAPANSTIEDRFVINYVAPAPQYAAEVTTNAYGLATFSFDQPLAPVEAGVKLYKGAISGNDLNLTQVVDYAAEQGVVVYGEANTTYHFEVINGATADFSGNELKAASTWAYPHAGTTAYVLSGSSLYIYEGENMKPNKAFLLLEANSGNAPRRISFRFNGATAFENVEMNEAKAVKFIEDGKVFIKRGDVIYNLQGQIVK